MPQPLPGGEIATRVDHDSMKPRRELAVAAELAQPDGQLEQRLLRGVAGVLDVAEDLGGQPRHAGGMALEQRLERAPVAVVCPRDEIRVAQPSIAEKRPRNRWQRAGGLGGWHCADSLLRSMPGSLAPDAVAPFLRGRFGDPYLYAIRCDSTQRALAPDLPEGAVAVCEEQAAGRGRLGRAWLAPSGTSILCSVLLRPPAGRQPAELSLVGGLATAETRRAGARALRRHQVAERRARRGSQGGGNPGRGARAGSRSRDRPERQPGRGRAADRDPDAGGVLPYRRRGRARACAAARGSPRHARGSLRSLGRGGSRPAAGGAFRARRPLRSGRQGGRHRPVPLAASPRTGGSSSRRRPAPSTSRAARYPWPDGARARAAGPPRSRR